MLVVIAGLMFRVLPQEFAPQEDRGMLFMNLQGPEGASLDYMDRHARQLEDILFRELESGDAGVLDPRGAGRVGGIRLGHLLTPVAHLPLARLEAQRLSPSRLTLEIVEHAPQRVRAPRRREPRAARRGARCRCRTAPSGAR